MRREELEFTLFPGLSVVAVEGDAQGSEGVPDGWIRVSVMNPAGGVSTNALFPRYLDTYEDIPPTGS